MNDKDRKEVSAQLRLIDGAPTEQAAGDAVDARTDSDAGRQYPAIKPQWDAAGRCGVVSRTTDHRAGRLELLRRLYGG